MNFLRLCTCDACSLYGSVQDPMALERSYRGQYIGAELYKVHQSTQNAKERAACQFQMLQTDPALFHQYPPSHPADPVGQSWDHTRAARDSSPDESESSSTKPKSPSDVEDALMERLRSINSRIEQIDIANLIDSTSIVFVNPPSQASAPMVTPSADRLELAKSVPGNANAIKEEKWLSSAEELMEELGARSDSEEVHNLVTITRHRVQQERSTLLSRKMCQWETIRMASLKLSTKARRVNSVASISKPFLYFPPTLLLCYILIAYMHLLAATSLKNCKILLRGLKKLMAMNTPIGLDPHYQLHKDIPLDPATVISLMDLEPKTKAFICCPSCFHLYNYNANQPTEFQERCSYKRTKLDTPCDALLLARPTKRKKKANRKPVRLFLYHEIEDFATNLYARLEQYLDRNIIGGAANSDRHGPPELWDIMDAPELQEFLGPEKDPQRPFLQRPGNEGRAVFSLNMDGLNPFGNKESGKKVSVGAIYLVCLNLPVAIRYKIENMFLVAIIPGPNEPSKEQINHILRPLVDDLLVFWHHGFFLTATPMFPHGRLVRGAIIPLICDLPAARQMSGFAGHSSNNFCSFCLLKHDDIDNFDVNSWTSRTREEHQELAREWRDAETPKIREKLYRQSGIRWSELLRLPYWDPTRFVMIDSMHGFFLRLFQTHCRQIWGMSVEIEDGDYPSFAQDKLRPSDVQMERGFHILRYGDEIELQSLKTPVLRELARLTDLLPYGGKPKKLLKDLIRYRLEVGWFTESGEIIEGGNKEQLARTFLRLPEPAPDIPTEEKKKPAASTKKRRPRNDPPTPDEIELGLQMLQFATKKKLKSLRKMLLLKLCELKNVQVVQNKPTIVDLANELELWRRRTGLVDPSGNLTQKKSKAESKTKRKDIGILGSATLKEIRDDMDAIELPSWVSPAPRQPGEAKRGKFTADQWRSFCIINLTLTLNRLWGQEPEDSRKRLMLDNFMHLVTAVKLATMRCMTPARITQYEFHIHAYLTGLLNLYPGTTIAPYHHLALHFQHFLRRFGPVHAWRCFPFERYNYLLQGIPTNMKFGELESTLLTRFCQGQKLKALLQPQNQQMSSELDDLLSDWDEIANDDIRGTLLSDTFSYNEQFHLQEEECRWSQDQTCHLPDSWYSLLKDWLSRNDGDIDLKTLPRAAYMRDYIKRLGETFQTEQSSPRDSHIYFRGPDDSHSAGIIQGIFSHTRYSTKKSKKVQTFFVVKPYIPLPPDLEKYDAYRRFPEVGGRIYCDAYSKEIIISNHDLLYHFAAARVGVSQIPVPCVVALPLGHN